jgi:hypothetical protein
VPAAALDAEQCQLTALNEKRLERYDAAARERAVFIREYGNGQGC